MSFAFSTIVMLLLVLPGLLFFRGYFSNEFSSNFFKTDFVQLVPIIIIPSLILHLIFLAFLTLPVFKFYPNIEYVGILVTANDTKVLKEIFANISANIFRISFYFISLYAFSVLTGFFSWLIIRKTTLDRKLPVFRYPNRWYYILTGEIFDFSKKDKTNNRFENSKNISIRYVDVLVQVGTYSLIYSGILHSFMLSKYNTGVDYIKLRSVKRKKISVEGQQKFKKIPGEYLLLPFNEIKNINITYYDLKGYFKRVLFDTSNIK
jgi:hypothetical protein